MRQATAVQPPAGEIILTYDDYAELPNDGKRYEIIEGDIFVTPAPTTKHQNTIGNLYGILFIYLQDHPIGKIYLAPIDLILSPTNVAQPDLLFMTTAKRHFVSERGIEGPPDLIVEVLSPTTAKMDRTIKSRLYARFGVPHYWLIDPIEKRLEMFRLAGKSYRALPPIMSSDMVSFPPLNKSERRLRGERAILLKDPFPGLSFPLFDLWR